MDTQRIFNDESEHQNTVELIGFYGGDREHACSAWTSTSRELTPEKEARIPALLKMLAENNHHTPFEKSALHFLVKSDIATHIHLLKHRIGVSINAESARYKELKEDKLFIPDDWPDDEIQIYLEHMEKTYEKYHNSLIRLTEHYIRVKGMKKSEARKRAKESSRFYLPYGNQILCDMQFNFRSFSHFIGLRYSTHAQREVCELAKLMLKAVQNTKEFDLTLRAFGFVGDNGSLIEPFV